MLNHPVYTSEEARIRQTFLALIWSLSYPGRVYELPAGGMDAFYAIADTVLDLETSYYSPHNTLGEYLAGTGARALAPDSAAYHFYPVLDEMTVAAVASASTGTLTYPDQSASLIVSCQFGSGHSLWLQGPGIPPTAQQTLQVTGIPLEFWQLRARANRYPLGWDIYLVADARVIGLPRTTQMTLEE